MSLARVALIFSLGMVATAAMPQALSAKGVYDRVRDSMVRIECETAGGTRVGTGFFFQDGRTVATCFRLIEGARKITLVGSKGERWNPSHLRASRGSDTALLILADASNRRALFPARPTKAGNLTFFLATPPGEEFKALGVATIWALRRMQRLPVVETTVSREEASPGSPLLDRYAQVVGMISLVYSEGQTRSIGVGVAAVAPVRKSALVAAEVWYASGDPRPTGGMEEAASAPDRLTIHHARTMTNVLEGFARWRIAEAGVAARDAKTSGLVAKAYAGFLATLNDPVASNTRRVLAERAELGTYVDRQERAARTVSGHADRLRRAEERKDPAAANKALNYLGNALRRMAVQPSYGWMDRDHLTNTLTRAARGQLALVEYGAVLDPSEPDSLRVCAVAKDSPYRAGDQVEAAMTASKGTWTAVATWDDFYRFWLNRGTGPWSVRVTREGQSVTLPMPPTAK